MRTSLGVCWGDYSAYHIYRRFPATLGKSPLSSPPSGLQTPSQVFLVFSDLTLKSHFVYSMGSIRFLRNPPTLKARSSESHPHPSQMLRPRESVNSTLGGAQTRKVQSQKKNAPRTSPREEGGHSTIFTRTCLPLTVNPGNPVLRRVSASHLLQMGLFVWKAAGEAD